MTFSQLRIKALFVRAKGIEPIRLTAPDPKSGLSTNFNTPADLYVISFQEKDCKDTIYFLKSKGRLLFPGHFIFQDKSMSGIFNFIDMSTF